MIHKLAYGITAYLCDKKIVQVDEKEIYEYGMELLVSSTIGIVIILFISIATGYLWHGVIFLFCFISVRMYTGGYHADTYVKCNAAFAGTYIGSVIIWQLCEKYHGNSALWILTILSFMIVGYMAPVENKYKQLQSEEKEKYKKISVIIYAIYMLVLLFIDITGYQSGGYLMQLGRFSNQMDISLYIKIILNIIVILMIMGQIKESRDSHDVFKDD